MKNIKNLTENEDNFQIEFNLNEIKDILEIMGYAKQYCMEEDVYLGKKTTERYIKKFEELSS